MKQHMPPRIPTDGKHYSVLYDAARDVQEVLGLSCEIGLRRGGGTQYMIDGLTGGATDYYANTGKHLKPIRTHIAIDPYGGIPYYEMENKLRTDESYPNDMMKEALADLYLYVQKKPINFLFFPMEDTMFFDRFHNGIPVYGDGIRQIVNEYALVYFDGPHTVKKTLEETYFFHDRTQKGSMFVYDNVAGYYDHDKVNDFLLKNGWEEVNKNSYKASYRKIAP